jgi:hypothetical protein
LITAIHRTTGVSSPYQTGVLVAAGPLEPFLGTVLASGSDRVQGIPSLPVSPSQLPNPEVG